MNHDPSRIFPIWPQPPKSTEDPMAFQTPRPPFPPRNNWKGKKAADKRKKPPPPVSGDPSAASGVGGAGYQPPALNELQFQNRLRARRFYPKNNNRKFTRFAPYAPRNTTSFIIRAKKSGGIASLVSPCPVTPAILPTPKFSPSREGLVDMAKEKWGVDGYGSMKGLIRLRPGGAGVAEEEDETEEGSSESDVEEHVEVERRLDHDLSRFEMVYPSHVDEQGPAGYLLENRVDDQDTRIARLEEENLTLKERLFLVEREMHDIRRRMQVMEAKDGNVNPNNNDNVSNNNDNNEDNDTSFSDNNMNVNEDVGLEIGDEVDVKVYVGLDNRKVNENEGAVLENGHEVNVSEGAVLKNVDEVNVNEDAVMKSGDEVNVNEDAVTKSGDEVNVNEDAMKNGDEVNVNEDAVMKSADEDAVMKSGDAVNMDEDGKMKSRHEVDVNEDAVIKSGDEVKVNEDAMLKNGDEVNVNEDAVMKSGDAVNMDEDGKMKSRHEVDVNEDAMLKNGDEVNVNEDAKLENGDEVCSQKDVEDYDEGSGAKIKEG